MGELIQLPVRHDPELTKRQLAQRWGVTERTIERYVASGLPSTLRNKRRRFRLSDSERWREEMECRSDAAAR